MPDLTAKSRRGIFAMAVILTSGLVWIVSWQVSNVLLQATVLNSGITLVYLPAGVRLAILLIAGFFGAAGIAFVFPLALLQAFGSVSVLEALIYSGIAGFVPYAAVLGVCRMSGVAPDLKRLRSAHLPLLAAAVSIAGSVASIGALIAFGRFPANRFLTDVTAMAAGDFLGCFAVVALLRVFVVSYRSLMR